MSSVLADLKAAIVLESAAISPHTHPLLEHAKRAVVELGRMDNDLPYTVELWEDGEKSRESYLARCAGPDMARAAYEVAKRRYPGRLVMLCNNAMILSRSDRDPPPNTIPVYNLPQED